MDLNFFNDSEQPAAAPAAIVKERLGVFAGDAYDYVYDPNEGSVQVWARDQVFEGTSLKKAALNALNLRDFEGRNIRIPDCDSTHELDAFRLWLAVFEKVHRDYSETVRRTPIGQAASDYLDSFESVFRVLWMFVNALEKHGKEDAVDVDSSDPVIEYDPEEHYMSACDYKNCI